MSVMKRDFLMFTLGAGVGGTLTWLFIKEEYAKMAFEEIKAMEEHYKQLMDEVDNEKQNSLAVDLTKKKTALPPKPALSEVARHHNKMEYNRIIADEGYTEESGPVEKEAHPEDDPAEEPFYDNEEKYKRMRKFDEPYIIDDSSYHDENLDFEKISICYYAEDDTLADENEEIIPEVDEIVGDEALVSFGVMSDDPDTVYVRNERLGIDYEIIRVFLSYKETVLGIVDEDPPHPVRRKNNEQDSY